MMAIRKCVYNKHVECNDCQLCDKDQKGEVVMTTLNDLTESE